MVLMDINILIPFISGILLAVANLYIKNGMTEMTSFTIRNLIFNKVLILGLIFGVFGGLLSWYSLKNLPLWMVILTINTVSTIVAIFLGVFVLKEFITPLRSIMIILTITFLIGVMVVK